MCSIPNNSNTPNRGFTPEHIECPQTVRYKSNKKLLVLRTESGDVLVSLFELPRRVGLALLSKVLQLRPGICLGGLLMMLVELLVVLFQHRRKLTRKGRVLELGHQSLKHDEVSTHRYGHEVLVVRPGALRVHFAQVGQGRGEIGEACNAELLRLGPAEEVMKEQLLSKSTDSR